MKKYIAVFACIISFFIFMPSTAQAQSVVKDDANVLSQETEDFINQLNTNQFAPLYGAPEYAVVTMTSLDDADIEEVTQGLFDEYGFGNPEYNNGLVFVMAVEDREFRLGYGDGFTTVFQDLSEDDIVTSEAKSLLREENYNAAMELVSTTIYDYVLKADQEQGLAAVYTAGMEKVTHDRQAEAERHDKLLSALKVGIVLVTTLSTTSIAGFFIVRRYKVNNAFRTYPVIPSHLKADPLFSEQTFIKYAIKKRKVFHQYQQKDDCLACLSSYLTSDFFPKKLSDAPASETKKQLMLSCLNNPAIGAYVAHQYLANKQQSIQALAEMLAQKNELLADYGQQLRTTVFQLVETLDISKSIAQKNQELLPKYKQSIQQEALSLATAKEQHHEYLAALVTGTHSYEQLIDNLPTEAKTIIETVQTDALFKVDLAYVYKEHPELKERVAEFDQDDYQTFIQDSRRQYQPGQTDYALLYMILMTQATHQEEAIAAENSSSDFGGFSGGGSSGGGVSGSW